MTGDQRSGPLAGLRVVEFGGMGPAPFATMLLADLGAEVVRVEKGGAGSEDLYPPPVRVLSRGVRSIELDLKSDLGRDAASRLAGRSDALVEGFRPGVMERLRLGPEVLLTVNPALVYARMTGWGQDGPRAQQAGHDINYIAAAGALSVVGRAGEPPAPPVNLVGDFGGGGMLLVVGVLSALLEARTSGRGQVVDAAMLDGAALLTTVLHEWRGHGTWSEERGTNFIDSGAPFYDVYPTADGGEVAVGAIEPRFWADLLRHLDVDEPWVSARQHDRDAWPAIRELLADRILNATAQQLQSLLDSDQSCVTRVRRLSEVGGDAHSARRRLLIDVGGIEQPAPAPRFSRTPASQPAPPEQGGASTSSVLLELGYDEATVERATGAVLAQPQGRS